jgi:hypothetical protein
MKGSMSLLPTTLHTASSASSAAFDTSARASPIPLSVSADRKLSSAKRRRAAEPGAPASRHAL